MSRNKKVKWRATSGGDQMAARHFRGERYVAVSERRNIDFARHPLPWLRIALRSGKFLLNQDRELVRAVPIKEHPSGRDAEGKPTGAAHVASPSKMRGVLRTR